MLERVLTFIHNWFPVAYKRDRWEVVGGTLDLPFVQEGQYFRIVGSVFNDGLHQYPVEGLQDEEFTGEIWALAVPKAVVEISEEIEEWNEKHGDAADSPFNSESFGGYTYSKGTTASSKEDVSLNGWQQAFASRLTPWRKLH